MAIDFTVIKRTGRTQLGSQVIKLANQLRDLRDRCDALNDAASRMHDGSNYDQVESMFSLEDTSGGGNFVTLLQNLQDILNTNATVSGDTRLSRIDEFVSRLAGQ